MTLLETSLAAPLERTTEVLSPGVRWNGVILVGEGLIQTPGEDRINARGRAILNKALWAGGLKREDFLLSNSVPFRVPKGTKAIIACGDKSFHALTGENGLAKRRGYIYKSEEFQCNILGTFHPNFIGRGKTGLIQALLYDLKIAWKKPLGIFPFSKLILYPTIRDFASWTARTLNDRPEFLAFDIETPYSHGKPEDDELEDDPSSEVIRISFGLPSGEAITVPWIGGYIDLCKELLASEIDKVLFNGDYDVPRVEFNQCKVNGLMIDVMWLFHFLFPDLPRSLAAAASFYTTLPEWKSLGSKDPELYSALDSHATVMTYLGVRKHLQEKGMWTTSWDHVVRLMAILRKIRRRGLLIDRLALRKFQHSLRLQLAGLNRTIDSVVPESLKPKKIISGKSLRGRCKCLRPVFGKMGQPTKRTIPDITCGNCSGSGWNPIIVKTLQFNPGSSEQLMAYSHSLGHKVPTRINRDTGETKETTEKKFLIVLSRQYPTAIYADVLKSRQIGKLLSTYANWPMRPCPEFGLNARGKNRFYRVSTRLGQTPATGRLSSENPNMQNIPKEGPLAERFKAIIHATPGHRIVKRDYSGIEAVLTGYFAGDPDYMRLALLGVHTFRCAEFKGEAPSIAISDKDLGVALKGLKKKYDIPEPGQDVSLYQRFKKINHMTNYGAKPVKIWNESPGVFKDLPEVRKLYAFFRSRSPKIFSWHKRIERSLPREGYRSVNPYMYNRYFWDLPADLPKAIAQGPQSTAAAIIKESMLLVDDTPDGEFMVLQVHDELVFDFPEGPGSCACHPDNRKTWQERDESIRQIMERRLPPLGGMKIFTEGANGLTYACH